MNSFFYASATGWIATILVGVEVLLPYLLRRTLLSERLDIAQNQAKPYLQRMWPHYWAGYLLAALALAHAWIPMSAAGRMARTNLAGLWLATVALGLIFLQILFGLFLQQARETRRILRVTHFWTMLLISALVLLHMGLNGSLLVSGSSHTHTWLFLRSFVL
jgi:hypothetical protein